MPNPASPAQLILSPALTAAIIAHALADWPEEVCGLVRGRAHRAIAVHPARNTAPDPIRDYQVDPRALLMQFAWEDEGDALIAIYHSHPASPAYPSASDAWQAHYPDAVYLICSLADRSQPVIRGFFLRELPARIDGAAVRSELHFHETRPGRWGAYLTPEEPVPPSLIHLDRPAGLALYIVQEEDAYRAISVQPVEILSNPA